MVRYTLGVSGCGYCKPCVRGRLQAAMGRPCDPAYECAYKHILDSYTPSTPTDPATDESFDTSQIGSCCSNCRWTSTSNFSSGSSSYKNYDHLSLEYESEEPGRSRRRRTLPKRKKV